MQRHPAYRAFTLVEILVVVVIIAVLAAIVLPQFAAATDEARYNAFITSLDSHTEAMIHYAAVEGGFPPDGNSGSLPVVLEPYINKSKFESPTDLGGAWDIEYNDLGITSAVGVHFNDGDNPGDEVMERVDGIIDDGDLSTGGFRKLADDRYYNVLR